MNSALAAPAEIQWGPTPDVLPLEIQGAVLCGDPTVPGVLAILMHHNMTTHESAAVEPSAPARTDLILISKFVTPVAIRSAVGRGKMFHSLCGQRELKRRAPWLGGGGPQSSPVCFDDGAADRETHPQAAGLCRVEGVKDTLEIR